MHEQHMNTVVRAVFSQHVLERLWDCDMVEGTEGVPTHQSIDVNLT
jgi:hypothetical protein